MNSHHVNGQRGRTGFRPDINGLRALAIFLVVGFHAWPKLVPGGFVGVDVFFVVSGYLICGIVMEGLQDGSFEFLAFYERRAVRILPALLVVLASTCAFGWICLYSFEFASLGEHAVSALAFFLNFMLWSEAGYFDTSAFQKPLLHLWSLSIEEQFYLLFPFLMWSAGRLRLSLRHVILVALLLSFALNLVENSRDLVGDFFNPASRAWEILAGALLAANAVTAPLGERDSGANAQGRAWLTDRYADLASILGLMSILGSALLLHEGLRFPGWYALLPTAGTVLIILGGTKSVVGDLLSNRWVRWLGLISYPLYLWHWPILSFAAILQPSAPRDVVTAIAIALALALALLTFTAIERPIAAMRLIVARRWLIALPLCVIALFGFTAYSAAGFPERAASLEAPVDMNRTDSMSLPPGVIEKGCGVSMALEPTYAHCEHDSRGPARFALLGDSKAASLAPGLFSKDASGAHWLVIGGYVREGSTPVPVLSDAAEYRTHQASLRPALAAIADDKAIRVVVLATATRSLFRLPEADSIVALADSQEYPVALDGLDRSVAFLLKAGKKIVLLVDNPTFRAPPLCVSRITSIAWVNAILALRPGISSCQISRQEQTRLSSKYRTLLTTVAARHPGEVFVFDTLDVLCDPVSNTCSAMEGNHHLYSYSDHISTYAARKIAKRLIPFIETVGGRDAPSNNRPLD